MKITEKTHLDHGIPREWLERVIAELPDDKVFVTTTRELPSEFPDVMCALHPNVSEKEVFYARRGARDYTSRLTNLPPRLVREVTILCGLGEVWTAFGGPLTPKEPNDPYLKPEERATSEEFWSKAALSASCFEIKE